MEGAPKATKKEKGEIVSPQERVKKLREKADSEIRKGKKESGKPSPSEELTRLKKEAKTREEEYDHELEDTERSTKYSKWQKAVEKYRKQEEKLDLGLGEEASESDYRARLAELKAEMDAANERYEHEMEDLAKSKAYSDWLKARERYREMEELMDLLTSEKNRAEDKEAPADKPETAGGVADAGEPAEKEPVPTSPKEATEELPTKMERVVIVNADARVELAAVRRAEEILTARLKNEKFFKRHWIRAWEPMYRAQYTAEERKRVLGQENKPGFFKRKLFGANRIEATGRKDLFAGHDEAAGETKEEMRALAGRFDMNLQQEREGETKEELQDEEINAKINDLIFKYASSEEMDEVDFDIEKETILAEIAEKYPSSLTSEGLSADNLFEAARTYRAMWKHNGGLARTDLTLSVDLGVARKAIKTDANITWLDKVVSRSQRHLGPLASPEAVAFAVSLGSFFVKKPVYWLGGAAGLGALMGAMRKNVEQKRDLAQHRRERAMGAEAPEEGVERRKSAERYVYDMKSSLDLTREVTAILDEFESDPTSQEARAKLLEVVSDAEARLSLSEERQSDLIAYEGETSLERGRLDMLKSLATAKGALGKAGIEDIESTDEYSTRREELEKEMNAIDSSERWQRWGENGKAAVVGAVGGLVVGGLTQEALALVGDNIRPLHWLRPGGKATSMETLYHYMRGDLPTAPSGAGLTSSVYEASSGARIQIDGTTEIVRDRTSGLMHLVDKNDPSQILAKFSTGPSGHVTPVPGSYDPNFIGITSQKIDEGAQTLSEWIETFKNADGNVTESVWHRAGVDYFDNSTVPKAEFNELRMYMSFDKDGGITIDASKLQEYLQGAAGEQVRGSSHAGETLDVAKAYTEGTVKIGIAPDGSSPTSVLELKYEPGTHTFVAARDSDVARLFGIDAKGNPVLKGDGFMGIVHETGVRPDGSKEVEWINSIRGNGDAIKTPHGSHIETEITRRAEQDWWGPWMWHFRRKPLEEREPEGLIGSPYPQYWREHPEPIIPEGAGMPDVELADAKAKVDTRGQMIPLDQKDWVKGYPESYDLQSEKQMAEYLYRRGNFNLNQTDAEQYVALDRVGRLAFLEDKIRQDREFLDIGNGERITRVEIEKITDTVLKYTDATFDKYGEKDRSLLPDKERIHVVGALEYQAQTKFANDGSFGVCFNHSGEIFVNFDMLRHALARDGALDKDMLVSQLKRTIAHEVAHGSVANNYWMFTTKDGDVIPALRRTGVWSSRRENAGSVKGQLIKERGRALNEAITEELAKEITDTIYDSEDAPRPSDSLEPYSAEREILHLLQDRFDIPFATFAEAAVNRKSLRTLVEKLNGKVAPAEGVDQERGVTLRPRFMSLLMSLMDYEFKRQPATYSLTRKLIAGEKGIVISAAAKRDLPANLLESDGSIKQILIEQYGLIDAQQQQAKPIAA